jgi:tight adherence protein C
LPVIPSLLVSALVFSVLRTLYDKVFPERIDLTARLKSAGDGDTLADVRRTELKKPLADRLFRPVLLKTSALAAHLLPGRILPSLAPKIEKAGLASELSASEFLGIKVLFTVVLPGLFYNVAESAGLSLLYYLLPAAAAAGWKLPDYYLWQKMVNRIKELEKSFPDTLDLLTVSVEAGLGFDGALAKVAEKSKGIIAGEFRRLLQEVKMGKSRRQALKHLAERTAAEDIRLFVSAVVQAEQFGLPLGKTLRQQSEQMRRKRRQRVEEQAMKAPVKMLLPLVVFIFPTIFLVLLGPAVIQIMDGLVR